MVGQKTIGAKKGKSRTIKRIRDHAGEAIARQNDCRRYQLDAENTQR